MEPSDRTPPHAIDLLPIAASELSGFLEAFRPQYVEERMHADHLTRDQASDFVARQWQSILHTGVDSPGHHFFWARESGSPQRIGLLWMFVDHLLALAFVYQILLFEPFRGRGLGRRLLTAAESFAREQRARAIGLNVFSTNERAISLYRSAGYATSSQHMTKALPPDA